MKLFRFLNPDGDGLYQGDFAESIGLVFSGGDIPYYQPPVYEDYIKVNLTELKKYSCAFHTMDSLVMWFRDINPLDIFIQGGKLIELDVPDEDVFIGRHQCVFRKYRERSIREINADEFIDLVSPVVEKRSNEGFVMW